ncbi:hypothetical protein Tco_0303692 [Tanacetum coccineum]
MKKQLQACMIAGCKERCIHKSGMVLCKYKCDDGLVVKARRGTKSEMKDECSKSGNDTQAEEQLNLRRILKKLESTKVVLERQLSHKIDDSKAKKDQFLKEINHLRTQLENLKGKRVETKLDNSLILGKPPLLNNERDQLLKQIAFLESKLASQDIRSCQKEYHELRTSYNALKVKFDSLNRKKWNINVSKSSKPK